MAAQSLGEANLALTADLSELERNLTIADRRVKKTDDNFEKLERQAKLAERAINKIRMEAKQAGETDAVAERVKAALGSIRDKAAEAHGELDDVKLTEAQAVESEVAGRRVESTLDKITRKANEARRALLGARLAGAGAGGGGGGRIPVQAGNPGRGFGPFGSGYGRVGLLGAAVGGATLLGPAAGPGALGLLAAIPTLAAAGAGALGTLALGFAGVGKAIGGDLKAFKALQPAQQQFVLTVRSLKGWLDQLREEAGESLFPGLTKGLKAALSPSTLGVISRAVKEFGSAIGAAGAQWGKYFGSAQFANIAGPLFEAGAKTLSTMSDAALSLFDSLGVLGRAAVPLVKWLTDGAAAGARIVDSFVRAQDASGGLAGALDQAQTSLRLVGQLGLSALRVFGALGQALYPVSRIAVKDLTDGLNALAGIIDRNQTKIQEIVGGALAALRSTVEVLTPLVGGLAKGLDSVAESIGGWKVAFEIVIGGYLITKFAALATSILGVGTAAGEAGAAGEVGLLTTRLGTLAALPAIAISLYLVIKNKDAIDSWLQSHHLGFLTESGIDLAKHSSNKLGWTSSVQSMVGSLGIGGGGSGIQDDVPGWVKAPGSKYFFNNSPLVSGAGSSGGGSAGSAKGLDLPPSLQRAILEAQAGHGDMTKAYAAAYAYYERLRKTPGLTRSQMDQILASESLYSTPHPDFTKNVPKSHHQKTSALDIVFPPRMQAALSDARTGAAGGSMGGLQRLLAVAKKSLDYLNAEHRTGKKLVVLNRERASIASLIASTEQKIYRLQIAIPQRLQDSLANAKAALSGTTASALSAESLNARAAALAKIVAAEDRILDTLRKQHVAGAALGAQRKKVGQNETARGKALAQLRTIALQAGSASQAERILGIAGQSGQGAQLSSLRTRERSILTKALGKAGVQRGSFQQLGLDQLLERAHNVLGAGLPNTVYLSLKKVNEAFTLGLKNAIGDKAIDNIRQRFQQITQTLQEGFDGFNLTVAEQKRHFLDTRFADVYHARAGTKAGAKPPVVYAPTFHSTDPAAMERKARADYFRFRLQMAG